MPIFEIPKRFKKKSEKIIINVKEKSEKKAPKDKLERELQEIQDKLKEIEQNF